ncbi:unnamed protein product [Vitrella brassicaformis CCMP3155]|uniref:Uncharacterized protein n=1 Tax=Vitrella brassicaformis (strain CCMP3155) TaxID=1169540 RepID=A0A0G4G4Z8_VITBC|nr:unnamed protein product [Vitrella brassicaformis CCMP3155]|eukprot:CEM23395.1 unnamed protein product [Vitrella brassicaformis CCMP3155]
MKWPERDELRARVAEEVPRERGGMGGWIKERGGVVDHQYIVKSGAKRVGVKLHEEKGILPISQAQEVWGDRTAAPDRNKLLTEGVYKNFTSHRPNKWRHLFTAKEYIEATSKQKKVTIRFAAGDSCLQAVSTALLRYQEAEPRAVRGAVKPIIIIETCDGWIIIIIIIIWWIKIIKERKCISCPELDGIENIQVAMQPVSSGKRDITDSVKLVQFIQQQHPTLTLRGMVAGFLLNGGSHCPRVVSSLPEAFTLLETHNDIDKVVEVVSM